MTNDEYLKEILKDQELADDSKELKTLQEKRDEVEALLRNKFRGTPRIRYGGSKAKGTLIRESYDLDITCYFPRDDEDAGGTLEEIYNNVKDALASQYLATPKGQAIRLMSTDGTDFHIDVVPGRFIDGEDGDVFLYRTSGDKKRLKTNLDTHIEHVRESGVRGAIKLLKLWRARHNISVRTFVLELLTIGLLDGWTGKPLEEQLTHVFTELSANTDITVKDPANPEGNNLSDVFNNSVRTVLSTFAQSVLSTVGTSGWEGVYGKTEKQKKIDALKNAAGRVTIPTKPWCSSV